MSPVLETPFLTLLVRIAATLLLTAAAAIPSNAFSSREVYPAIYPWVDFATYVADDGTPEYDWIVRPGGDPSSIHMSFPSADQLYVDRSGNLVIEVGPMIIRHTRPVVYQDIGGERRFVQGEFTLIDHRTAGFKIAPYDRARTLIIDPRIEMGASFGGSGANFANEYVVTVNYRDNGISVAQDAQGNIYVAGNAASKDFPLVNPLPPTPDSCPAWDQGHCLLFASFVAKLDPSGRKLLYSTLLGNPTEASPAGFTSPEQPDAHSIAMAVDRYGNVYLTGAVGGLAVKLDPDGELVWSQDLGKLPGIIGTSIALEPSGKVAITGTTQSGNLPVTSNAYRITSSSAANIFLMELDSGSGAVAYSTYLGPAFLYAIAPSYPQLSAASDGSIVIASSTNSPDWPTTPGVLQPKYASTNSDAFDANVIVLKLDTAASRLVWATYLGGSSGDRLSAMAGGPGGDIYLTGTTSSTDFPHTPGAVKVEGFCQSFLTG